MTNPRFHVISAESSPCAAFTGKSAALNKTPPKCLPNSDVAFIEKARTAYTTPSRPMPVSSSRSAMTCAGMEFALAVRRGIANAAMMA